MAAGTLTDWLIAPGGRGARGEAVVPLHRGYRNRTPQLRGATPPDKIRTAFLTALTQIDPDLDAAAVSDDDHLQEDLEFGSMDILNLVAALHRDPGVDIPELDSPGSPPPALPSPIWPSVWAEPRSRPASAPPPARARRLHRSARS